MFDIKQLKQMDSAWKMNLDFDLFSRFCRRASSDSIRLTKWRPYQIWGIGKEHNHE